MTSRRDLEALIARLEKAMEGSWGLDADILLALKMKGETSIDDDGAEYERLGEHQHFTRSMDAALTLVPEGWTEAEMKWWKAPDGDQLAWIQLGRWREGSAKDETRDGYGNTRALALCIAALRARLAEMKE